MKLSVRSKSSRVVLFVVVSIVLIIAVVVSSNREPQFQGVALSVWVERVHAGRGEEATAEAEDAVREIGADGIPFLIGKVRSLNSPLKSKVLPWLAQRGLLRFDWGKEFEASYKAGSVLQLLGPTAAPAIPSLVRLLPKQPYLSASILAAIGPEFGRNAAATEAVPLLIERLNGREPDLRDAVMGALRAAGAKAIPALLAATHHSDELVRQRSVILLGSIGAKDKAIPVLVPLLHDKVSNVRLAAAIALSRFGTNASFAVPEMRKLLHDDDSLTVIGAASALAKLDSNAHDAIEALVIKLNDPRVCAEAASALGQLGPAARDAVPALMAVFQNCLRPPDPALDQGGLNRDRSQKRYHGLNAALALGSIGSFAEPAIPLLISALDSPEDWIRRGAVEALGALGSASSSAVPKLIGVLRSKENDVRREGVRALIQIDPCSDAVSVSLFQARHDAGWEVRASIATALPTIARCQSAPIEQIIEVLSDLLGDERHEVRLAAVRSLGELAPKSKAAMFALKAATMDRLGSIRRAASVIIEQSMTDPNTGARQTQRTLPSGGGLDE